MSDINVQTFSGKVNITSNLLVGSSHLFVDTVNNRVGLITTTPDAGIHVNSNAYVHTDFRVGSEIVMNDTTGQITAGSFVGDGSGLDGINSDSGSWVNGTNSNVHLATLTDKVGIGTTSPIGKLDVRGAIMTPVVSYSSNQDAPYLIAGTSGYTGAATNWNTHGFQHRIKTNSGGTPRITVDAPSGGEVFTIVNGGNVGIGVTDPPCKLTIDGGTGVNSAGGVLAIRQKGDTNSDGITLTSSHSNSTRLYKDGNGHFNIYNLGGGSFTLENGTGNVGIGTASPQQKLEVHGNILLGQNDVHSFIHGGADIAMSSDTHVLIVSDANDVTGGSSGDIIFGSGSAINMNSSRNFTYAQAYPSSVPRLEHMRIKGSGNVGIGTTDPTEALHIYRDGTDPTYMWLVGNTSDRAGIAFSEDSSSKHAIIEYDGTGSDTGNYLAIYSGVSTWTAKGAGLNFIPANGRVGIGTSSPDAKLHVNGNAIIGDVGGYSGVTYTNAQLTLGGSHNAGYNLSNQVKLLITGGQNDGSSPYYIMCEDENGYDQFYVKGGTSSNGTGGKVYIKNNVGIGTTSPEAKLHVQGQIRMTSQRAIGGTYNSYLDWPNSGHHIDCYKDGSAHVFHINHYAQRIVYLNRSSYSDYRIKEDIKDIDDVSALDTLRKIKPKTYKYKLQPEKGTVYGFIAQDVREVLPYATNLSTLSAPFDREKFVNATILEDGMVNLDGPCNELEIGKNAYFYYESSTSTRDFEVTEIISPTQFRVRVDDSVNEWIGDTMLVGKEVNDFHGIDKDAIFTVATAALQEVDRQLQTTQTELKADLQTTRTDLQTIQTQLNTHTHPLEEHTHQDLVDQLTTEKARTYELQKKVELLEMSHSSLIQRIEALENL